MIRNYWKVAIRHLARNKAYLLINTLGMGIALTCCMTAYLLIAYDLEFDDYLEGEDRIVKVIQHVEQGDGSQYKELVTPIILAPIAAGEIAGIEQFTRYTSASGFMSFGDNAFSETIYFADASFFNLFSFKLVNGSTRNFNNKQAIFISERLAKKYFAEEEPLGKTLSVEFGEKKYDAFVGGVLEKMPLNSSFTHEALMRIENYIDFNGIEANDWSDHHNASVLLSLADTGQRERISQQLNRYTSLRNETKRDSRSLQFELVPFNEPFTPNNARQSYLHLRIPLIALFIFAVLAFIILLIACFNLTNTTLAMTGKRLKEIGVRKVVGSSRVQIINQFLLEMVITICLAIVAGVLMAQIVVPEFASMWGLGYGLGDLNGVNFMIALIILLFISSLLAGIYPALLNSRFQPIVLLKGGQRANGTNTLTRTLLVGQFSLSVIVLLAGIVFTQNAAFQQKISFGYDKENLIVVTLHGEQEYERMKTAISANPKIEGMAPASNHIGPYSAYNRTVKIDTSTFSTQAYEVGTNYFDVVGMDIVAGRNFTDNQMEIESAAIVDENFVRLHGLTDPIDAQVFYQERPYRIIGVVKNHLNGLKDDSKEDHFYTISRPQQYQMLIARANPKSLTEIQKYIEAQWKKLYPGRPFQSDLQEDIVFKEANEYNRNLKQIFLFLTVLGCLLSASGIYSLASLNTQKRLVCGKYSVPRCLVSFN